MHTDYRSSETALTAAAARAAHLLVDAEPFVFVDDLAAALLGDRTEELLACHHRHGAHPVLAGARAQATCRARFTEDRLAALAGSGLDQYVILGAGLDSFAYRSPLADRVRVFEVDRPATQLAKRAALAEPSRRRSPLSNSTSKRVRWPGGCARPDSTRPGRRW